MYDDMDESTDAEEDPLGAARGALYGGAIGMVLWAMLALIGYSLLHFLHR